MDVTGTPSSTVAVLVKGARMIDIGPRDAEPVMRDYGRESPWRLGPPSAPIAPDGSVEEDSMTMGQGLYGPAPKPEGYDQ